ncbi:MAG: hypothetical protein HFF06_05460 [Oscillospiraceae bacterium]|jgi:hypothetical protein|nr:hypothetical protein [Oscillospiraceae bacterium]
MKKKLKVAYCYVGETDSMEVWAQGHDEKWGMAIACRFQNSTKDPHGDPCFLHYDILHEIDRWVKNGWEFIGMTSRPE